MIMEEHKAHTCNQEVEWIRVVARTNLVAADRVSFGKLIGRDLSQNSVAKNLVNATPFIVHAIWNELSRMVSEESRGHLTLWAVLRRYREASDYCIRHKYLMRCDRSQLALMLDYAIFGDTKFMPSRDGRLDSKWRALEEADIDFRLVLLISLKVLPLYSGKGKVAKLPLATLREFLYYYISREEFPYQQNQPYLMMIIDSSFDIYERMAAIIVLVLLDITIYEMSSTGPAARRNNNKTTLEGVAVDEGTEEPILWQEEGSMSSFWYFMESQDAFILCKCDYTTREYVNYTLHLGTEFSRDTCRLLDPHFILNMAENRTANEYLMFMKWHYQKDEDGSVTTFGLDCLTSWKMDNEWAGPLRHLRLRRMAASERYYQMFARNFSKSPDARYCLSDRFSNRYPETSYYFATTLYAITRDYLSIQDVRLNENGEYECVPNKFFDLPRAYAFHDCRLSDPIGLLIVGEEPSAQKKYIIIDDLLTCYPIEHDCIVLPPIEE